MKTDYQKVEGMLYGHYRRKKRINSLKSRIIRTNNRISRLRTDIKECNVCLDDTLKGIDYSKEYVNTGQVVSNIERELEKAIDNILKSIAYEIRRKRKTQSRIRNLEKAIDDVEVLLEELSEEELQIIELRYGEKKSDREIADMINMSRTTVQRKRTDIIKQLIEEK
jgi:RNA polymerase sigma factor (sigma-70 family)